MSLINVSELTFAYDGSYDNVFENVSFQLDTDWKLGFTGRNGRGKTTFLNLLLGKYHYSGTISTSVHFEYFPYHVADTSQLTSDVIDEICGSPRWMVLRELNLLRVSEDVLYRPFETLSSGEKTKVLFAAMFTKENSFMLIDEPTNHLDAQARELVAEYLKKKKGFILVSHDRKFLDECTDHTLSINRADIEVQKGNFSAWYENKQRRDNFELAENEKLKKDISRLKESAKRTQEWSDTSERKKIGFDPTRTEKSLNRRSYEGAKSKKMMSRSKSLEDRQQSAIDEKSKLLKNLEKNDSLKLSPLKHHSACLAELRDVSVSYDGKAVCSGVSFSIMDGDRIALCGRNGCGKSSIIKLINGFNIAYSGNISIGSGLKISYVAQTADGLSGSLTDYAEKLGIEESLFKAILRKLDFQRVQFEKNMEDYSEGQKKKVLLAGSLCEKAHLYIWDEPLNFIDILSRIQIENLIKEYQPTIIFVEHDKAFTENIATKLVNIG